MTSSALFLLEMKFFQLFLAMEFFLFTETVHIKKENIGNVVLYLRYCQNMEQARNAVREMVVIVMVMFARYGHECVCFHGHGHYHVCQMMISIIVMIAVIMVMVLAMVRDMEVLVLFMIVSLVMYCTSLFGSMSKSWL